MNIRSMILKSFHRRIPQTAHLNATRKFLILTRLPHEVRLRPMLNHFPPRLISLLAHRAFRPLDLMMLVDVLPDFQPRLCLQPTIIAHEHFAGKTHQMDILTMPSEVIKLREGHAAQVANFTVLLGTSKGLFGGCGLVVGCEMQREGLEVVTQLLALCALDLSLVIGWILLQALDDVSLEGDGGEVLVDTATWTVNLCDFWQLVGGGEVQVEGAGVLEDFAATFDWAWAGFDCAFVQLEVLAAVDLPVTEEALDRSVAVVAALFLTHWTLFGGGWCW